MPAREYVTGEDRDMAFKLLWNAFLPRLLGMKFSRLFFQSKRAAVRNDDFEELYHRVGLAVESWSEIVESNFEVGYRLAVAITTIFLERLRHWNVRIAENISWGLD